MRGHRLGKTDTYKGIFICDSLIRKFFNLIRFHMHARPGHDWVDFQGVSCFSRAWRMRSFQGMACFPRAWRAEGASPVRIGQHEPSLDRWTERVWILPGRSRWLAWSTSVPALAKTPSSVREFRRKLKLINSTMWRGREADSPSSLGSRKSISPRRNKVGPSAHGHTTHSAVILCSCSSRSSRSRSSTGPAEHRVIHPTGQQRIVRLFQPW